MRRREFITLLGGAAVAWPLSARAQQPKVYRIGVLMGIAESDEESQDRIATFRQTLQELGWIEGRNVQFEVRFSAGDPKQARDNAAELLSLTPDVMLAHSSLALGALRQAARTVPIVSAQVPDPVGGGFVASLPRPGGNITGFTSFEYQMSSKWLELLKEIAPTIAVPRFSPIRRFRRARHNCGSYNQCHRRWACNYTRLTCKTPRKSSGASLKSCTNRTSA